MLLSKGSRPARPASQRCCLKRNSALSLWFTHADHIELTSAGSYMLLWLLSSIYIYICTQWTSPNRPNKPRSQQVEGHLTPTNPTPPPVSPPSHPLLRHRGQRWRPHGVGRRPGGSHSPEVTISRRKERGDMHGSGSGSGSVGVTDIGCTAFGSKSSSTPRSPSPLSAKSRLLRLGRWRPVPGPLAALRWKGPKKKNRPWHKGTGVTGVTGH